jgi:uncharacterized protein YecT (DUF1311 family)
MDLFGAMEKRLLRIAQRLQAPGILGVLLLLAPPIAAARPAATATDCSRATTRDEKAICTTPELRAADAAMAKAYSALKAELPRAQQSALLANQQNWMAGSDVMKTRANCTDKSDRDLAGCLLAQTEQRRRFLAGEGPNRAPDAPRLRPIFDYRPDYSVVYPRIVEQSPSDRAFNKAAHSIPARYPAATGYYDASYDVTYLDRRLAAVVFTIEAYEAGAAHPDGGPESLIFDFSRGRALVLADIVRSPAEAVRAISGQCRKRLEAQGQEIPDGPEYLGPTVGKLTNWAPDKAGVDILFDPGALGAPSAAGPQQCRLAWADVSPWLKPGGPLPPH